MMVATREPSIHSGAPPATTAFGRFMNVLQAAGSLLAIPVGLASGYSIYHANFSAAARCQGLRANIVSMLDKSADASTLRILVRRDVATFEQNCGTVDPGAVAAFKTLLSANKAAATAALPHVAARPPVKEVKAKPAEAKPTPARPVAREASDAKWLTSVRAALVRHRAKPAKPLEATPVLPIARPAAPSLHAAAMAAPIASVSRPERHHPVPPALIPDPTMTESAEMPGGFRTGTLISRLPLIGGMFGR